MNISMAFSFPENFILDQKKSNCKQRIKTQQG